jgi:hypothetical protein
MALKQYFKLVTKRLAVVCCVFPFFISTLLGQELESLNKKELRTLSANQFQMLDTLQDIVSNLQRNLLFSQEEIVTQKKTILKLELLVQEKMSSIEDLTQTNNGNEVIISQQKAKISELEQQLYQINERFSDLIEYSDSLKAVLLNTMEKVDSSRKDMRFKNWLDHLDYGSSRIPDGNLKFQFEGVIAFNNILNDIKTSNDRNWSSRENGLMYGPVLFAPEFISQNQLKFHHLQKKDYYSQIVISKSLNSLDFESMMPTIEIIKGKVATFKFDNNTEEDFIVTQIKTQNNGVLQAQLNFANEMAVTKQDHTVFMDDVYRESKDLFFPIYEISGKKYLCLNHTQLIRLKVPLSEDVLYGEANGKITISSLNGYYSKSGSDIEDDLFLSRNSKTSGSYFLSHPDCIFLFALISDN